jgi:uncharacterized phage protein gp47/JayE
MPWSTPTLRDVRGAVRDAITGRLPGADANVPNSVLRVVSDAMGALCHLALQYIDWLARQLLPDTAETEWLDRHGHIWLTNADGSTGRKLATLASGTADFNSIVGINVSVTVPAFTQLTYAGTGISYQTTADIITDAGGAPTPAPIQALDPGSAGNLDQGVTLGLVSPITNLVGQATVVTLTGGTDDETDDELRARVLKRIRQPPMGGDETDYEQWALAVPGVTRAWAAPQEMGIGTMTVRFLEDDLRANDDGWPTPADITVVADYIDTVRPVTVKDMYVVAPIKQYIDITILNVMPATAEVRAEIEQSVRQMLFAKAAPGQTIYAAWVSYGIMSAPNVQSFDLLTNTDYVMPDNGHMAVLGTILYSP